MYPSPANSKIRDISFYKHTYPTSPCTLLQIQMGSREIRGFLKVFGSCYGHSASTYRAK
jgi:hypothetical protein